MLRIQKISIICLNSYFDRSNDPVRNAGKIRNKGFEFNIGWNDRINNDFSYSANFIGSFNRNEVINMGTDSQVITGGTIHGGTWTTRTLAGYPIAGFIYSM